MSIHGIPLLLTPPFSLCPFSGPPSHSNHLPLIYLRTQLKYSIPICRYHHGIGLRPPLLSPLWPAFGNFISFRRKKKNKTSFLLEATRRESPYDVLGVSPSATPQEIKRAYRKLALKFHPDVNKEPNAQEKFMRIKHAYNTLLNSESQFKYDFRNRRSEYSNSASERNRRHNTQDEEEFYGFEDFFRDMQEEFQNWETNAGSQGKPKSLWEELADIGEELVEFLEKELNITDSNFEVDNNDDGPLKGNPYEKSGSENWKDDTQNKVGKESSIEDNIDEIEAALAQLKKELGL
eukprot:TRINITY_DN894_c0_g1_i1.p1 TRINITY_DN894_c0_g1~~TRINITY_DN894_c0_g1_i1.p1  ORF type:complete len:292 (+),score=62.53 TRINITY_DN894_c0_g1_i1:72-947(+)